MSSDSFAEVLEAAFRESRDMDAPLGVKLQKFADAVRSLDSTFAEAVDRLVTRLQDSNAGEAAPAPGETMPPFVLPDQDGRLLSLEQMLSKGPVAVAFHRGHWCPYCRINANALAEVHDRVTSKGGQIVAITPDRRRYTQTLKTDAEAPYPILSDLDNGYALSLNLAIWVGEEMRRMIHEAGWNLASYQGNEAWMLPIPATFIVGSDGRVVTRYIDPDYRRRMAIDDLVNAFDGLNGGAGLPPEEQQKPQA